MPGPKRLPARRIRLSRQQSNRACCVLERHVAIRSLMSTATYQPQFRSYSVTTKYNQNVYRAQLDDSSSAAILSILKTSPPVPQTLTEKIIQRHSVSLPEGKFVRAGDYVTLSPEKCMTHDNSWPVALKFMSIGASKIRFPRQIVMALDHDVQNKSDSNLKKYRQIEEFAKNQGVNFYPAGRGIGHQIMVEEGYAWPGSLAVASDRYRIVMS